ncbi:unnamed protein product [Boreogadus saida]
MTPRGLQRGHNPWVRWSRGGWRGFFVDSRGPLLWGDVSHPATTCSPSTTPVLLISENREAGPGRGVASSWPPRAEGETDVSLPSRRSSYTTAAGCGYPSCLSSTLSRRPWQPHPGTATTSGEGEGLGYPGPS